MTKRALVLRRERLDELGDPELAGVAGGTTVTWYCPTLPVRACFIAPPTHESFCTGGCA